MALRGCLTHWKTRRLARLLGIPVPCALGVREALWHVTAELQPDGGIGRMSDVAIAEEMFWEDEPATLIEALVQAGILDRVDDCRLYVHDWHEHADHSVRKTLTNRRQCFANGTRPFKTGEDSDHESPRLARAIRPRTRRMIFQRDQGRCRICGATAADGVRLALDHIVPVARGGTADPSNLRVLCSPCNAGKGCLAPDPILDSLVFDE